MSSQGTLKKMRLLTECLGLGTVTLVDVGARWGIDPKWDSLGDRLRIIGFDPDPEECRRLNARADKKASFYPFALSDQPGEETLNIAREPGRSSLYQPSERLLKRYPDSAGFEVARTLRVPVDTMDGFVQKNGVTEADFVKLDVQGSEKKIISGGEKCFRELVFGIETEVEFSPLYARQPLFAEVDDLCRRLGFTLFDLKPCYWKRVEKPIRGVGQLMCGDALYFKDYIQAGIVPNHRAAGAAIALCVVYRKYDFAGELLDYFTQNGIYSVRTRDEAGRILADLSRLRFPFGIKFRGGLRMAGWLDRLSQRLKGAYWAQWDDWKA